MLETIIVGLISFVLFVIGKTAIVWGPLLAMYAAFEMWHHFVTDRFIVGMQWTLFEIEVPRDVEKTPQAMELVFTNALYHASQKGIWETWVVGAPHFWFSLEIAGIDGGVHFYIRTPSRIRDLIETQVYAQYPQAKVKEVEDYTLRVPYDAPNDDWNLWGCEFKLQEHFAIPLRTYKDYGLDKPSDKEELKIDPLTPTIEYLGSLRKGQQVWIQFVIRPAKEAYHSHETHEHQDWVQEAQEEMRRLTAPYTQEFIKSVGDTTGEGGVGYQIRLPEQMTAKIKKMNEKIQKLGFDVGIRLVILAENKYISNDEFKNQMRAARLIFRQYNNPDLNSLIRHNGSGFDTPWADPTGRATWKKKNRVLNWYRVRIFYHPPFWYAFTAKFPEWLDAVVPLVYRVKTDVLNVEELATLFHFPGQVSQAPSFRRVESKVAKPPANLPI